jgi:hypothetical protein
MKKLNYKVRSKKVLCLKNEMDGFMKHLGLDEVLQDLRILEVWEECVGSVIAKNSIPVELRKNKLMVSVENAVWRYELSTKKEEILTRLNEILNKNSKVKIKDIVFI